jgi:predicted phosphodiesterase
MRIMYLGDIHGNFNLISQYIDRFNIKDTYIIQVGDFGVGFKSLLKEKRELELYHTKLVKNNVIVYAIRGNHDYKPYFDNDPFGFTNIKLVKDYTVLNLEGKNILCIGGAVSVDRMMRKTKNQREGNFDILTGNENWWQDELFNWEDDKLVNLRNINVVVTHTAPDYCVPDNSNGFGEFVNGFFKNDTDLKLDLIDERRLMTLAFQTIKMHNDIEFHYYGHFHRNDLITIDGTKHRLLGVGELWEER